MPNVPTYSVGEIVAQTGAKERSILMWADADAIRALGGTNRAGRGVHRQFDWREVEIAAVLAALAPYRLPIGVLVHIGDTIRRVLSRSTSAPAGSLLEQVSLAAEACERARHGEHGIKLVLRPGDPDDRAAPLLLEIRWPGPEGMQVVPAKAELTIDLAACWEGLRK